MVEFGWFVGGVSVNRIVTKTVIRDLMKEAEFIQIIRSGVYFVLGHCADVIEEACNASDSRKYIRIVLPSIFNQDVSVRAREAGRDPADVLARLGDWHEALARLSDKLQPKHSLELRTTMEPHRYHAIFSESQAILGIPWHTKASLTTSSFFIGPNASSVISNLHEDFDIFYNKCTPYKLGDNERNRGKQAARVAIDDEILLGFGRLLPWVLDALRYIASAFPVADGSGATKDHLHAKFGTDKSDCNKRLLEMEAAGLLHRVGDRAANDLRHGRLVSGYGKLLAHKYKDHHFGPSR